MSFVENLNQLPSDTIFSLDYIQQLKKRLEIQEGLQLIIEQSPKKLSIRCSNDNKNVCTFVYKFCKKIDVESKQIGLEFIKKSTVHSAECKVNNQYISFERNFTLIQKYKDLITNIMISRFQLYGPQNPKKILEVISQGLGYNVAFINKGLQNPELKKKIKKKFDNIISEIRNKFNIPPSLIPNSKLKKRTQKKKLKFSEHYQIPENFQEDKHEYIEQFFVSDESEENQSEFEATIQIACIKNERPIRRNLEAEKEEVKQEANFDECVENDQNTANTHETYGKTKPIRKY